MICKCGHLKTDHAARGVRCKLFCEYSGCDCTDYVDCRYSEEVTENFGVSLGPIPPAYAANPEFEKLSSTPTMEMLRDRTSRVTFPIGMDVALEMKKYLNGKITINDFETWFFASTKETLHDCGINATRPLLFVYLAGKCTENELKEKFKEILKEAKLESILK